MLLQLNLLERAWYNKLLPGLIDTACYLFNKYFWKKTLAGMHLVYW